MTEALFAMPAHLRQRLVRALETEALPVPCSPTALRAAVNLQHGGEEIVAAIDVLAQMGMNASVCAIWIRSVDAAACRVPRSDLVWSGPDVPGVHARDTRRVYEELLGSAQRSVWACSYVFFDGPKAFKVLAERMDSLPELRVVLLLNIQRKPGDKSVAEDVVRRFADRFWKSDWPGKARPQVFYDPRSVRGGAPTGVLHAKAIVADEETVFVTSANFTEAALDRNIEMGLTVRDRALALSVISHFRALIDGAYVSLLPES